MQRASKVVVYQNCDWFPTRHGEQRSSTDRSHRNKHSESASSYCLLHPDYGCLTNPRAFPAIPTCAFRIEDTRSMLRHPKTISLRLELFRVIFTFHSLSSVDAEIKRDEQWNEVGSSFARASCSIGMKHNILQFTSSLLFWVCPTWVFMSTKSIIYC